jgi:hypothetical protein
MIVEPYFESYNIICTSFMNIVFLLAQEFQPSQIKLLAQYNTPKKTTISIHSVPTQLIKKTLTQQY